MRSRFYLPAQSWPPLDGAGSVQVRLRTLFPVSPIQVAVQGENGVQADQFPSESQLFSLKYYRGWGDFLKSQMYIVHTQLCMSGQCLAVSSHCYPLAEIRYYLIQCWVDEPASMVKPSSSVGATNNAPFPKTALVRKMVCF